MDRPYLEYIRSAKHLNPCQARWALFFACFTYTITFRPSSRNVKPDTLSRVYSKEEEPLLQPDTALPSSCIIGAITWPIEERIRTAQLTEPDPGTGPPDRLFVPSSVRSEVVQWANASKLTGHPGVSRSVAFLRRFWWHTLEGDTKTFVAACPVCAQNMSYNQSSSGLLLPLPIPRRPWSHLALDFVTGLPPSDGHSHCSGSVQ